MRSSRVINSYETIQLVRYNTSEVPLLLLEPTMSRRVCRTDDDWLSQNAFRCRQGASGFAVPSVSRRQAHLHEGACNDSGSATMPLSRALANVFLTYPCPHCGHKLEKPGAWFQSIGQYRCNACRRDVRIRYNDKAKLFDAHIRLADNQRASTEWGQTGKKTGDPGAAGAAPMLPGPIIRGSRSGRSRHRRLATI
jgi:hypothetical protein